MNRNKQEAPKEKGHSKKGFWIAGILVILILSGVIVVLTQFNIETIQVTGNVHYTEDEIIQRVLGDEHWNNTLLLYLKNKIRPPEGIPFVQKVDVEFISRHVITITVYEKALAGCVEFMNEYMYFDKDGMVLESSSERMEDIPCITGIRFDQMIMYEPLPIEDKDFFHTVLTLTQLLQKYQIPAENIQFTSQKEIILYYENIKILLGDGSNIEEQISELGNILKSIEGKSGTLYMKDYSLEKGDVIFRENQ